MNPILKAMNNSFKLMYMIFKVKNQIFKVMNNSFKLMYMILVNLRTKSYNLKKNPNL